MENLPAVKEVINSPEVSAKFYKSYMAGGEVNYDIE